MSNSSTFTFEMIADILNIISTYSNYGGALLEFTVIVFLLTSIFINREIYFRSAYYVLYLIGLIIDFIAAFIWFINFACFQYKNELLFFSDNLSFWYSTLFVGFWNFILAINRFTALMYPLKQSKLWSSGNVKIISILLLLYPFIINGYTFANLKCKLNMWSMGCESVLIASRQFTSIANIIQAAASLFIGILTFIKMPPINAASKIDRRMLAHSIYSSCLLTLYAFIQGAEAIVHAGENNHGLFTLIKSISNIVYLMYHYSSIIILFLVWFVFCFYFS